MNGKISVILLVVICYLLSSQTSPSSVKNPTKMPDSWGGEFDEELNIGTLPGLKFDLERVGVSNGSKVKLTFVNDDNMPHNLVITMPGQADKIGLGALKLGPAGEEKAYVPDLPDVLYHTSVLPPNTSESIYFEAPETSGTYDIVCTFPGHYTIMRAILEVR